MGAGRLSDASILEKIYNLEKVTTRQPTARMHWAGVIILFKTGESAIFWQIRSDLEELFVGKLTFEKTSLLAFDYEPIMLN